MHTTEFGNRMSGNWGTRQAALLFALIAAMLAPSAARAAAHHKHAAELEGMDPQTELDVIVQFRETPTAHHHEIVARHGGTLKMKLGAARAGLYHMTASEIEALAAEPEVRYVSPDREVRPTMDLTTDAVQLPEAMASYNLDGSGVGVAVIDSGISPNPDFNPGHIVKQQSWVAGPPGPGAAADVYGHGTMVAGIIAGTGKESSPAGGCASCFWTFSGVAPGVNLINLRVLDGNGAGTDSNVIAAIQTAIAMKNQYNIRVINLSLGRGVFESYTQDPLCQAVEAAWNAGIVVVVAAGNNGRNNTLGTNGYGTINSPANDPLVITVGAMKSEGTPQRTDDLIASYSSKGPTAIDHVVKPDLVAPGNLVVSLGVGPSTLSKQYPGNWVRQGSYCGTCNPGAPSQYYYQLSGTSMAAPVVSGAAALMIEQHPEISPDKVKARLMKTAYKTFPPMSVAIDTTTVPAQMFVDYYDIFTVGAGYLDIAAALANTDEIDDGSAASPVAAYNAATGQATLVAGTSVIWGSNVIWGTSVIWGSNVIWGTNVIWGSNVIWGTSISASNVIWGSSVIWGTGSVMSLGTGSVAMIGEQ